MRVGRRVPVLVGVGVCVSVAVGGTIVNVLVGVGFSHGRGASGLWIKNRPSAANSNMPAPAPSMMIKVLSCVFFVCIFSEKRGAGLLPGCCTPGWFDLLDGDVIQEEVAIIVIAID